MSNTDLDATYTSLAKELGSEVTTISDSVATDDFFKCLSTLFLARSLSCLNSSDEFLARSLALCLKFLILAR